MKKILLINRKQYGYHTDTYKYSLYLKSLYKITYVCFDSNKEKFFNEEVDVIYISRKYGKILRTISFYKNIFEIIYKNHFDYIFVKNFPFSFLLQLIIKDEKVVLDIRTSSVARNRVKRKFHNLLLRFNTYFFTNITIISHELAKMLNIKKYKLLPLGAEILSTTHKDYEMIKLIYVGTLENRNIHETLQGLKNYLRITSFKNISYDIFGAGSKKEVALIEENIHKLNLSNFVTFHGFKPHHEIRPYFDSCNVGVSYIPTTCYFDNQPPTKTFEYIFAGMICIATNTTANKKIITAANGILCDASVRGFTDALIELNNKKDKFRCSTITASLKEYSWKKISLEILHPYLESLDD